MHYLRQSTSAIVLVGPVLDADGAAVTGAVIGDFRLSKNGTVETMAGNTIAHDHNGMYRITLTTANTDTIDRLMISMGNTAYGMTAFRYTVLTANQYDALIANGTITPAAIEAALVNDGDATALLQAIADKIAGDLTAGDLTALAIVSAIKADATLAQMISRIDVATSTRLASGSYTAPPTAATVASAVWDKATVDHTSTGSFGAGVGYIITTVAAILVAVNTLTSRISSGVATMFADLIQMITGSGTANAKFTEKALEDAPGGATTGTGARTVTVTVNDGTNPLQNATVRMTEGANTFTGTTNGSGVATFNLDDATYTVSISKSGYSFAGASLVVDGTETVTYSMTQITFTPSSPSFVTGYWTCYTEAGVVESGVSVTMQAIKVPTEKGFALDSAVRTGTSNGSGIAQFANLIPGATYKVKRGTTGEFYSIKIPDDATGTIELNSIIGN